GWTTVSVCSSLRRGPRGQHVWKASQDNPGGLRRWEIRNPNRPHKLARPVRREASPERAESLIVARVCWRWARQGVPSCDRRGKGGALTQRIELKQRTRGWPGRPG